MLEMEGRQEHAAAVRAWPIAADAAGDVAACPGADLAAQRRCLACARPFASRLLSTSTNLSLCFSAMAEVQLVVARVGCLPESPSASPKALSPTVRIVNPLPSSARCGHGRNSR